MVNLPHQNRSSQGSNVHEYYGSAALHVLRASSMEDLAMSKHLSETFRYKYS